MHVCMYMYSTYQGEQEVRICGVPSCGGGLRGVAYVQLLNEHRQVLLVQVHWQLPLQVVKLRPLRVLPAQTQTNKQTNTHSAAFKSSSIAQMPLQTFKDIF